MLKLSSRRVTLLAGTALLAASLASGAAAAVLSGQVSDATGVKALQSAEVVIVELGRRAFTGSDGVFRFSDVPPGAYTLRTTYVGANPVDTRIVVGEQDTRTAIKLGGDDTEVEALLIVGQRANLASSLSRQRGAEGVESVLTRDAMGQFPDQNVAEAVRRAPGVNVLNDQGEGRFIAVRGLDPNLNSASINGARVPSPESDVRSVALDVIPAELIESIEIKKSLTPDMDGDTIGASIEINTTSAFDRLKPFLAVATEATFNEKTDYWSPKMSVDFSRAFGDRLGIAGGLSYQKRKFATDNIEADDWEVSDDGIVSSKALEYRDYDVERTRIGGSLSLDFRLSDATTLYARLLTSKFDDHEYRRRLILEMDGDPAAGTATTATFLSADDRITAIRDLKDRFESQTINSLNVGGRTEADAWRFDYSASYSKAREKEAGSLDPFRFRQRFSGADALNITFDYGDVQKPGYLVTAGAANFLDPSRYSFYRLERTALSLSEDEEIGAKFDARREFILEGGELEIQFGAKARQRAKTYDLQLDYYDGYDGGLSLAGLDGPQDYGLAAIEPVVGKGAAFGAFSGNAANFELSDLDTAWESAIADYEVDEDVYAGYLLARYHAGPLRAVGGVRVEQTRNELRGNLVELVEEGVVRNGAALADDTVFVTPVSYSRDYTEWLPSATVRFEAAPDLILRGGAFRSVVRPGIGKMAPRFIVEETEDDGREGEFGNPNLEPFKAWNLDLSAEWYFAPEAVVSGGLFYKKIKDFIVDAEFQDGVYNGVAYDEAIIPINGDEATVMGFEFNYQQTLRMLPEPFDGILLGFNYTYTDAEGDVLGRTIPLPASSKNTFNATIGYEKGPVSVRLAASFRDKYLDELGGSAEEDRYVADHIQYDLSAKYRVNKNFQVVAELVNLGDEPYFAYNNVGGSKRLLQYEEYSWTGKIGVRATF